MQVTSAGTSPPTASAACVAEQQKIAALEAANDLLNATVAAQAAEIAELRSRLLGRAAPRDALASTAIAAKLLLPPPPRLPAKHHYKSHTPSLYACVHISAVNARLRARHEHWCLLVLLCTTTLAPTPAFVYAKPLLARPKPCAQVQRSVRTMPSRSASCCRVPRVNPALFPLVGATFDLLPAAFPSSCPC